MRRYAGILIVAIALSGCAVVDAADKCAAPAIQQAVVHDLIKDALTQVSSNFDGPLPQPAALSAEGARLIQTGLLRTKLLTVIGADKDTGNVACDAKMSFHPTDEDAALIRNAAAQEEISEKPDELKSSGAKAVTTATRDEIDVRYIVLRDLETNTDRPDRIWDDNQVENAAAYIVTQRLHEQIRRTLFNVTPGPQVVAIARPVTPETRPTMVIRHWRNRNPDRPQFPYPMVTPTPDLDPDR